MTTRKALTSAVDALMALYLRKSNGETAKAIGAINFALRKPDLLMACPSCQMVDTPRLTPAFLAAETHLTTRCPHCGRELNSVRRSTFEYIYKEQQNMADDTGLQNAKSAAAEPANNIDAIERYEATFVLGFRTIQAAVHGTAKDHGWWEEERSPLELQMLIVSEVAEAAEAARHGNPPSDHIPEFNGEEEEYADVIIRIMDLAERRGLRIAEALIAKARFNETRPYRHGGKLA